MHVPQADDLDKVFTVPLLIADGINTAADIAARLDVVERQGFYYTAAAEGLGLIERDGEGVFTLSRRGRAYVQNPSRARRKALILGSDLLRYLARPRRGQSTLARIDNLSDIEYVANGIELLGVARSTAVRRAYTIKSWMKDIA